MWLTYCVIGTLLINTAALCYVGWKMGQINKSMEATEADIFFDLHVSKWPQDADESK